MSDDKRTMPEVLQSYAGLLRLQGRNADAAMMELAAAIIADQAERLATLLPPR